VNDVSQLIHAIADLFRAILWPFIVLLVLWAFRPEVRKLLERLKELTFPGGSAKFGNKLDELEQEASALVESVPATRRELRVETGVAGESEDAQAELGVRSSETLWHDTFALRTMRRRPPPDPVQAILSEAGTSPKAALISLSAEIEREAREFVASHQDPQNWEGRSLGDLLGRVELPPSARKAVGDFRDVRNRIVHGRGATDDEIFRAIDSGVKILQALQSLPRTVHVVHAPNVELFADAEGHERREGVHGVMLENRNSDGETEFAVYPTRRDHFEKGKAVAWEWDLSHVWPETWYRDPDTGEIKYGWTSAGEFVGRHLDEI
jgi:hypothetical protein